MDISRTLTLASDYSPSAASVPMAAAEARLWLFLSCSAGPWGGLPPPPSSSDLNQHSPFSRAEPAKDKFINCIYKIGQLYRFYSHSLSNIFWWKDSLKWRFTFSTESTHRSFSLNRKKMIGLVPSSLCFHNRKSCAHEITRQ